MTLRLMLKTVAVIWTKNLQKLWLRVREWTLISMNLGLFFNMFAGKTLLRCENVEDSSAVVCKCCFVVDLEDIPRSPRMTGRPEYLPIESCVLMCLGLCRGISAQNRMFSAMWLCQKSTRLEWRHMLSPKQQSHVSSGCYLLRFICTAFLHKMLGL